MCGPHHHLGRGAFAPDSAIACLLLQRDQNASVVGQRRADLSPGSAGRKPKNVPHPRRTPSPLLQGLGSRYTQAPSALDSHEVTSQAEARRMTEGRTAEHGRGRITNQICKESPSAKQFPGKLDFHNAPFLDSKSRTCEFFTDD